MVLVSRTEPLEPRDGFDLSDFSGASALEVEGFEGEGWSSVLCESRKSTAVARAGFCFTSLGSFMDAEDPGAGFFFAPSGRSVGVTDGIGFEFFEGVDSASEESGLEACKAGFFVGAASDFFFFFGSSSDSRARFFPFFTSSFVSSGIDTRVNPSHLPPSSSSSRQLHIGRLALELVLM